MILGRYPRVDVDGKGSANPQDSGDGGKGDKSGKKGDKDGKKGDKDKGKDKDKGDKDKREGGIINETSAKVDDITTKEA